METVSRIEHNMERKILISVTHFVSQGLDCDVQQNVTTNTTLVTIHRQTKTYLSREEDQPALVLFQSEHVGLESLLRPVFPAVVDCNTNGPGLLLVHTCSLRESVTGEFTQE